MRFLEVKIRKWHKGALSKPIPARTSWPSVWKPTDQEVATDHKHRLRVDEPGSDKMMRHGMRGSVIIRHGERRVYLTDPHKQHDLDTHKTLAAAAKARKRIGGYKILTGRPGNHDTDLGRVHRFLKKQRKVDHTSNRPVTTFHGTSDKFHDKISRHGLRPRKDTGTPYTFGSDSAAPAGNRERVYSGHLKVAQDAAKKAAKQHGGNPVVYKVKLHDKSRLHPDEDSYRFAGKPIRGAATGSWLKSMRRISTVAHQGRIPAKHLSVVKLPKKKSESVMRFLVVEAVDPHARRQRLAKLLRYSRSQHAMRRELEQRADRLGAKITRNFLGPSGRGQVISWKPGDPKKAADDLIHHVTRPNLDNTEKKMDRAAADKKRAKWQVALSATDSDAYVAGHKADKAHSLAKGFKHPRGHYKRATAKSGMRADDFMYAVATGSPHRQDRQRASDRASAAAKAAKARTPRFSALRKQRLDRLDKARSDANVQHGKNVMQGRKDSYPGARSDRIHDILTNVGKRTVGKNAAYGKWWRGHRMS